MKDTFSGYHPIINFTFFCAAIIFSMVFLHPVYLAISMTGSISYSLLLNGRKTVKFILFFVLPMMIVAGIINPLFNHRGVTILTYFNDNPITLESILYGIAVAIMFGSVIMWFSCFNAVMTTDKITFLFGRVIPALSLIFSIVMRFVPRFKTQIKIISNGQKCIGRDITNGTLTERARHSIKILSVMITWALENAIETADSMKSRGYGLRGRTSFSIYRFDARDKVAFCCLIAIVMLTATGGIFGYNSIQYFPSFKTGDTTQFGIAIFTGHFLLCFAPVILNIWEAIKWQRLQSKI